MAHCILMAMTSPDDVPLGTERVMELARERELPIVIAYVHDPELGESFNRLATDQGFMGGRVGEIVEQALDEDERLRAREAMARVLERLVNEGFSATTTEVDGKLSGAVLGLVAEHDADHVVLPRQRESVLRRLIFGTPATDLARRAPVKVEVVYEQ